MITSADRGWLAVMARLSGTWLGVRVGLGLGLGWLAVMARLSGTCPRTASTRRALPWPLVTWHGDYGHGEYSHEYEHT